MSQREVRKFRVKVFVDLQEDDVSDDEMTVRSKLDVRSLKSIVKHWVGECLSFQKLSCSDDTIC